MERRVFRAMGTEIELLVHADGADAALDAAEQEFHRLESLLSRFRADSELSRLNRDGAVDASHDLLRVVTLSLDGRERTGGRFDPTVHDALVAAGYDRTFDEVASVARSDTWSPPSAGGEVTLELSNCGLATSGRDRRRWQRGDRELHHLIDPKTGEPADSDVLRVTVVASDAVEAEIAAKALFLSGAERARTEADAAGMPAVIVTADGRTLLAGGIA